MLHVLPCEVSSFRMTSRQYQSLSDMQGFSEASALVHRKGRSQLCWWCLLGNPLQVEWRIRPVNLEAEEGYACWSCRSRETEAKPARETDGSCVVMQKEKVARLVDAAGGEDVKRGTSVNIPNSWVPEQRPPKNWCSFCDVFINWLYMQICSTAGKRKVQDENGGKVRILTGGKEEWCDKKEDAIKTNLYWTNISYAMCKFEEVCKSGKKTKLFLRYSKLCVMFCVNMSP